MKFKRRARDRQSERDLEAVAGAMEKIGALTRRKFLTSGAATAGGLLLGSLGGLLGAPRVAKADKTVETGQFIFPRLQFSTYDNTPDKWDAGPTGDAILRRELKKLTNINVSMEPKTVRLGDFEEMCRNPFVMMTADGFFTLPPNEEQNLREYLERGGFIMADDCVFAGQDRFTQSYMKTINRLYPDNQMRKIPYDHEVFHIYFDFPNGCPHMQGVPHGAQGLFEPGTGRIMTWLSPGDLHCGWMCRFWSMEKNMTAIKMGVNVIIYYLSH